MEPESYVNHSFLLSCMGKLDEKLCSLQKSKYQKRTECSLKSLKSGIFGEISTFSIFNIYTYFSPCIFTNIYMIVSIFSFWNKSTVHMRECGDSPHCVNFSSMLLGFKKASKTWLFVVQRVQCLRNSIIIIFRPLSCDMQKFKNLIVGLLLCNLVWFDLQCM